MVPPVYTLLSPAMSVGHWAEENICARETAGYYLPHAQHQLIYGVLRVQHMAAAITCLCVDRSIKENEKPHWLRCSGC